MNAFRYDAQQIKEQARLIRRNVISSMPDRLREGTRG